MHQHCWSTVSTVTHWISSKPNCLSLFQPASIGLAWPVLAWVARCICTSPPCSLLQFLREAITTCQLQFVVTVLVKMGGFALLLPALCYISGERINFFVTFLPSWVGRCICTGAASSFTFLSSKLDSSGQNCLSLFW